MIDTPTEIYTRIIEEFISAHAEEPTPKEPEEVKFVPRGYYLTPLLRVSKRWYANSAKYLYRSIAVGSNRRLRGEEIAKALHRTLKANSELAALVERLQLGIEDAPFGSQGEWTQMNTDILQLCPNVVHVEIRGYSVPHEFHALLSVLEEKSLVSFSISSRCLSDGDIPPGGCILYIFNLMQNWPKLRSFQMQGGHDHFIPLDPSPISGYCPDLREIEITDFVLNSYSYTTLRALCSGGLTKLSIWLDYGDESVLNEVCECLRAWSATLEYLKIYSTDHGPNRPLTEAVATLKELRVLETVGLVLDCGVLSNLPRLERICVSVWSYGEYVQLFTLLEDSDKFPSLTHFAGEFALCINSAVTSEFLNICRRREIQLGYDYSPFLTLFTTTRRSSFI